MPGNTAHEYEVREAINQVIDASRKLLDTDARPVRRDQHPKQHGCVRARFAVGKNSEAYSQGLFQHEKVYDAWIRLSNGKQTDDRKPDAHGMAVKVMGVEGPKVLANERDATTQDFVMVDHPTFFLKGAVDYAEFSDVLLKAAGKQRSSVYNALGLFVGGPMRGLLTLLFLSLFHWRMPTFLRLIKFASKRIANPVTTRYWSTTPYKFGETCMKFSAVPAEFRGGSPAEGPADGSDAALAEFLRPAVAAGADTTPPKADSPDYLREALVRTLALRGAVFLFQVQLFKDDKTTPIDDPTVASPDDVAPFHTVARIWIPKQKFDTSAQMAFGENLSFTPWHAIPVHEPLGEINEVRKDVYAELSGLRHRLNGVKPREPEPGDPDPADLPPRWGEDTTAFHRVLNDEVDLIQERRRHLEGRLAHDGGGRLRGPSADGSGEHAELAIAGRAESSELAGGHPAPRDVDSMTRQARLRALHEHTTGLALAGGGAGGATFAIGFLQGLASLGLIRRFDYLSASSSAGCAAAWLAAWLKREGGDPANVERQLAPSRIDEAGATRQYLAPGEVVDEEPQPLRHLRSVGGSPSARAGILSTDAWTRILSWARNVVIHLLVLVPLLVLIAVGGRLIVASYGVLGRLTQLDELAAQFDSRLGTPLFVLGVLALGLMFVTGALNLVLAFSSIAGALHRIRGTDARLRQNPDVSDSVAMVNREIVTRVLTAALLFTFCLPPIWRWLADLLGNLSFGPDTGGLLSVRTILDVVLGSFTLLGWPNLFAHALVIGGLLAWWTSRRGAGLDRARRKTFSRASFAAGATGGVLVVLLEGLFGWLMQLERPDLAATLVPALALLIVVAAAVVMVAASGAAASDAERAWWAAISGLLTKRAIYWIAAMATMLYLAGVIFAASGLTRAAIAMGWLGVAAFGVSAGDDSLRGRKQARAGWLRWPASVAAQLFFLGLLGTTALGVSLVANTPSLNAPGGDEAGPFAYYLRGVMGTSIPALVFLGGGFGILYALARRIENINLFSLDALRASRLTRCYLGASRPVPAWRERWAQPRDQRDGVGAPALADPETEPALPLRDPDPLTGLDPGDDLELGALRIGRKSEDDRVYWGPHLLLNTTMSTPEQPFGWRANAGESFFLSPLYCGSQSVGYARIESARPPGGALANLSLGRALAISAAAGDARHGSLAPGPLSALLTLFSRRAGTWIEKPKPDGWSAAGPQGGDLPLAPSLGLADGVKNFVYLTGGEEFERLGVYELIRRRCRYVVAVDAGDGGDAWSAGLAKLIRRCATDFGLRVEIDPRPLEPAGPDRVSNAHVAIGRIHYGDVDPGGLPGVLVYIRRSTTGDEPPEIQHHTGNHGPAAAGLSGVRQFFDDLPFECCRGLGDQIARVVFGEAATRLGEEFSDMARQPHVEYAPRLFAAVADRWAEPAKSEHHVSSTPARAAAPSPQVSASRGRGRALPGPDAASGQRS